MILVVDVHYGDTEAIVAGVTADDFSAVEPTHTHHLRVPVLSEYEPGQFYKRELPCIIKLLQHFNLDPDIILIDGFVDLGSDRTPGLGRHLFEALNGKTIVIGVAKSPFSGTSKSAETYRGASAKPLYVTAAGIEQDQARKIVESMAGTHRVPTLLKLADRESRTGF